MAGEAAADARGSEWKGSISWIGGRNNKQEFPMKQGVLTHGRVRLIFLSKGHSYPMDAKLSVLNLDILKKQMAWKHVSRMTENTVPLP